MICERNGMQTCSKLSQGQKKKIRQRRRAAETESAQALAVVAQTTSSTSCISRETIDDEFSGSESDSSSPLSGSTSEEDASSGHCSSPGARSLLQEEQCSESAIVAPSAASTGRSFKGWPSPAGRPPPGWPPPEAELLSCHPARTLPIGLQQEIHIATLPCPQPKDALRWRIYPLVRRVIALAGEHLEAREICKYVESNLPVPCLAGLSSSKLKSLVLLVLSRNVRHGRLIQHGQRYSLPVCEDARVPLPCVNGGQVETLWVAWSYETKRACEVALHYAPATHGSSSLWLMAQIDACNLHSSSIHNAGPGGSSSQDLELIRVGDVRVHIKPSGGDVSHTASWWDAHFRLSWSLLAPPELAEDALLGVVQQCVEHSAALVNHPDKI